MTETKIALVTGANRGLGFEIARQLADRHILVYVAARKLEDATEAASQIPQAQPIQLDVANAHDIANAVDLVNKEHGRLDILINNAGVNLEDDDTVTSADTLRRVLEINTIAPYAVTQAFLPLLKKSAAGRIVNQSSILGSMTILSDKGDEMWMYPGYSSSKAALNMLTLIQANKLKSTKIKVNAAHPGWARTRMGGDEAHISAAEGAQTAVRLALLPDDGQTGKFFHNDDEMPW